MKMKFEQAVLITTAMIFLALGGCEEYKSVASGSSVISGGGADDALYVPGGEGRTTDDLVFDENFRIFSMDTGINPEEVTTQETLGRWDDGKYHIQGLSYLGTSSLSASGFVDGLFVYWNKPLTGDYKITARVRMTAVQGFSTSKGIQFGVFVPGNAPAANGDQVFSGASRAFGILFRSSIGSSNPLGEIRFYYATDSGSVNFTAGTSSATGGSQIIYGISYKTEYILEMSRNSLGYTLAVKNSKTGDLIPQAAGESYNNPHTVLETASGTSALHPSVKYGRPVYAGFALMGCSAELSQIKIWDNADGTGDPVFSTPDTTPAYVPVETVKVNLSPAGSSSGNTFTYTAAEIQGSGITLTPSFTPTWADNNKVEWLMESCVPSGAINIVGTGDEFTLPGADGSTYETGKITIDDSLIPAGGQATAKFIAVARDLKLDDFTGFPPVDYPIKQTLAEYRFEITVTK
jgi:hypothetical protein